LTVARSPLYTPADTLELEHIETVFRGVPLITTVLVLTAVVASYPYWVRDPGWSVATWLAVFVAIGVVRVAASLVYLRSPPDKTRLVVWYRFGVAITLLHAAMWGVGGLFVFEQADIASEAMLHLGVAAVAMGTAAAAVRMPGFFPVLVVYTLLAVAPMAVRDVLIGGTFHRLLALTMAVVGVYSILNARNQARAVDEILAQQRRNAELTQALQIENERVNVARQAAEQANAAKASLFAAVNHDLRQPLHAVSLLAQVIRAAEHPQHMHQAAEQIGECVSSLSQLVDTLLELSQLDAGRIQPQWASFALDEVLRSVVTTHAPMAQAKNLSLAADASGVVVHSDPRLLLRVLSNLVANAVRYTREGGVQVRVQMQADRNQVAVSVRDTGVGIAAQTLPHIFEEFYQVGNSARDRRQGLGLGLATVKRLSDLLGLEVSVQSTLGVGSEFCCHVPLAQGAATDSAATLTAPGWADGDGTISRSVLVVEDDEPSLQAMQLLLSRWGCEVRAAASASQALAWVQEGYRPELVLADVRLGEGLSEGLDGGQLVQRLRAELGVQLPALLMTGDAATEAVRSAEESGLMLVRKPIKPAQLRAFMNDAFSRTD
jgi:two-component system, sensor histidine kinase